MRDERTRVIGLTGGTGVGKTTVGGLLSAKGAVVVDCDQLGRDVVAVGGAALPAIFERFGQHLQNADGSLDRASLASIVFNDADALNDLNGITHPAIDDLIASEIDKASTRSGRPMVILDMAVLVESDLGKGQYDTVVVVESDLDIRIARLAARGMNADDARARIASQATDDERREVADLVIRNDGTLDELTAQIDDLWRRLTE